MSRTYRRKSGAKWWRDNDFTYIRDRNGKWIHNPTEEEIEWYKKYMISVYEGRDRYSNPGITKDLLKCLVTLRHLKLQFHIGYLLLMQKYHLLLLLLHYFHCRQL